MFLCGEEIDQRLNWPLGKAERLAKRQILPHFLLPDGSIRFRWEEVEAILVHVVSQGAATAGGLPDVQ